MTNKNNEFRPSKGITLNLPYETNEKLEKYCKDQELKTGVKPHKKQAIINIINAL